MNAKKNGEKKPGIALRILPNDIGSEQALLGGIMWHPEITPDVREVLKGNDFYKESHEIIFDAISSMWDKEITLDLVTLRDELKQNYEKAGGDVYITSLLEVVSTSAAWRHHAEIIRKLSIRRQIIIQCSTITESALQAYTDNDELLTAIKDIPYQITQQESRDYKPNKQVLYELLDDMEKRQESGDETVGILTGFSAIDIHLSGLEAGCTYYLSAESHTGKSALALNVCDNIIKNISEGRILYFTLESTQKALIRRRLARYSQIALTRIRKANIHGNYEWENLTKACNELSEECLIILEDPRFSDLNNLQNFASLYARDNNLLLIVIDHLQLMTIKGSWQSEHLKVKEISRRLNDLAKQLKVPLLILSQVNQEMQMKESRDIYSNADNVWLMSQKENGTDLRIKLEATKGKDSGLWYSYLIFEKHIMAFKDIDYEER